MKVRNLIAICLATTLTVTACGAKKQGYTPEQLARQEFPAYCVRDVEFYENEEGKRAILDMPYYQWWNNTILEQNPVDVSREHWDQMSDFPICQPGDPRLGKI